MDFQPVGEFEQYFRSLRPDDVQQCVIRSDEVEVHEFPERGSREIYPTRERINGRSVGFHVADIEPDSDSGTHRHLSEAYIYIISGHGHTLIDGEKAEWSEGDTVWIPPMAWHSHHTGDVGARMLGMWNVPLLEALGFYYNEAAGDTDHPDAKRIVRGVMNPPPRPQPPA